MDKLSEKYVNTSVSEGTCKRDDIINAISLFVASLDENVDTQKVDSYLTEYYEELANSRDDPEDNEEFEFIFNDILDAMSDIAPEGCYFGAHPGDGADYGFWKTEDYQ